MKTLAAGSIALTLAAALGLWVAWPSPAVAQAPGFLTLEGPGSSIGVTVREVTQADADTSRLAQPVGVWIESVRPGSPAATAGFQAGDIVLDFNGERILSVRQFTRVVRESAPRRMVEAVVVRGTERQTLRVTPEATGELSAVPPLRNLRRALPRDFTFNVDPDVFRFRELVGGPSLGVSVMPLSDQLAAYFGVSQGALVTAVESGTPAAEAGLRAGDVITAINGRSVSNAADVRRELTRSGAGEGVDLAVTRERKELMLKATIPSRDTGSGRRGLPV